MLDGSGFCGFDICKKRLKTLATHILLENDLLIDDSGLTIMLMAFFFLQQSALNKSLLKNASSYYSSNYYVRT